MSVEEEGIVLISLFVDVFCLCGTGEDLFQIRGTNGLLCCSMDLLPRVCGEKEVLETSAQVLESFYPVSPTIDLQQVNVYREEMNCTGELSPGFHEIQLDE